MNEIILTGKKIKELTNSHFSIEDDKMYKFKQTSKYSEVSYAPTPEEQAIADYEAEKSKALIDLRQLKDDIELGLATQEDYNLRKAEWLAYHEANNPY